MNAPERAASRLLNYLAMGVESAAEITPNVVDDPIEGSAEVELMTTPLGKWSGARS